MTTLRSFFFEICRIVAYYAKKNSKLNQNSKEGVLIHAAMVHTCCVPGCKSVGKKIFLSFPTYRKICSSWIEKFWLESDSAYSKQDKVCRKHFQQSDFRISSNFLRNGVVPSFFLPPTTTATEHSYCIKDSIVSTNIIKYMRKHEEQNIFYYRTYPA